jgi:hypothetical protein
MGQGQRLDRPVLCAEPVSDTEHNAQEHQGRADDPQRAETVFDDVL